LFLLEKILPHMGKRRSERIQESISYIKEWKEWVENGGRVNETSKSNEPTETV
jgi:hypothetical protein